MCVYRFSLPTTTMPLAVSKCQNTNLSKIEMQAPTRGPLEKVSV